MLTWTLASRRMPSQWVRGVLGLVAALSAAGPATLHARDASAKPPDEPARRRDTSGRPWLGVAMDTPSQGAQGVPGPGVRIGHVIRKSPADSAGLKQGDRLLRVAGTVVSQGADVVHAVSAFAVGDVIEVAFVRAGTEASTRVTLAAYPSQDSMLRMDLVGAQAPAWRDVEGVSGVFPASVEALHGRVVLLDFWATWCAPCRIVAPRLGALQSRYGAQGLSVLGVSTEDAPDVAAFAQHLPLRYAVAVDKNAETTRAYGVVGLPTLVVIDKRGIVRDVSVGYDPSEDARLENLVRSLLAEPATGN